MKEQLHHLEINTLHEIDRIHDEETLIEYKNTILWKKGSLTDILKWLKDLAPEERSELGSIANNLRDLLQEAFEKAKIRIQQETVALRLSKEWGDMTLPFTQKKGSLHPITQIRHDVEDTFTRMGFEIFESMEITTEYLNFDAVNVPKNYPARDMQDTFWLEGSNNVLATQTSCMQNLILRKKDFPIRTIIPGRVFRNEDVDATHENTFYQVEGIVVDKNIGISHLKYTIETMLSDIFQAHVHIRMRPGYFPFVEPGVEVDFSCPFCNGTWENCRVCKGSWWIEFMGAGLIHPKVIQEGWLDPEEYSWFAFWFGLNRLAMIRYGIPDMRYFMNPDIRFLKQF